MIMSTPCSVHHDGRPYHVCTYLETQSKEIDMNRKVETVVMWSGVVVCGVLSGGLLLLCVKEIAKMVFEGLTTW